MAAKSKVIVGLSGGVDSAVAALLLRESGHPVEALFMKNWDEDDADDYCPAEADLRDAEEVCDLLGIRLHRVSFATEYWDRVFKLFLQEYRAGRTPNPDVLCNKEIKFRAFLDYALGLSADCIATGHYARSRQHHGVWELLRGADNEKDQTYFLYLLDQNQLARSLFPIGHLTKPAVRRIAAQAGLPVHDKKDSTGICFIGERRFREFLARFVPARPGEIRSLDGRSIGTHQGAVYYTLGQRQGLGIGGTESGTGEPWYVVDKDVGNNIVWVAQGAEHTALRQDALTAGAPHWIAGCEPQLPLRCKTKIRYRQSAQPCTITPGRGGRIQLLFDNPQRAITPGQAAVFYVGQQCLGGATIECAHATAAAEPRCNPART